MGDRHPEEFPEIARPAAYSDMDDPEDPSDTVQTTILSRTIQGGEHGTGTAIPER